MILGFYLWTWIPIFLLYCLRSSREYSDLLRAHLSLACTCSASEPWLQPEELLIKQCQGHTPVTAHRTPRIYLETRDILKAAFQGDIEPTGSIPALFQSSRKLGNSSWATWVWLPESPFQSLATPPILCPRSKGRRHFSGWTMTLPVASPPRQTSKHGSLG